MHLQVFFYNDESQISHTYFGFALSIKMLLVCRYVCGGGDTESCKSDALCQGLRVSTIGRVWVGVQVLQHFN